LIVAPPSDRPTRAAHCAAPPADLVAEVAKAMAVAPAVRLTTVTAAVLEVRRYSGFHHCLGRSVVSNRTGPIRPDGRSGALGV
jgi:hypothetical protein